MKNKQKKYYENNKEKLQEQAQNKYRELSNEERGIKEKYGVNRYRSMSEQDKEKLREYQRNYRKPKKI